MKNKAEQLFSSMCKNECRMERIGDSYVLSVKDATTGKKECFPLEKEEMEYFATRLMETGEEMLFFMKKHEEEKETTSLKM